MDSARPGELTTEPLVISLPVQWGDQDPFQHVNNVAYFRWMESARIAYFQEAGLSQLMSDQGVGPILASMKADFRRQLKYPDSLLVSATIHEIGRTSMKMSHRVYSTSQQTIAAEGDSVLVMFNYKGQRPVLVSDSIRSRIEAIERATKPAAS